MTGIDPGKCFAEESRGCDRILGGLAVAAGIKSQNIRYPIAPRRAATSRGAYELLPRLCTTLPKP